jgi:hypothetical protein
MSSFSCYGLGVRRCDAIAGHVRRGLPVPLPERFEGNRLHAEVPMNTLPAHFPEISLLLALLLSVIFWNVLRLVLAVLAVGFVLLVMVGMAGYGVVELLTS